jgi:hypothetical protein
MGFPPIDDDDEADRNARLNRGSGEEDEFDFVRYHHLRTTLANALKREAMLADAGDVSKLGTGFRTVEQAIPRLLGSRWRKLYVGLGFWDAWLSEAENGFPNNFLLEEEHWAPLAAIVAEDLLADRDITDPRVLGVADKTNTVNLVRNPHES